MAFSVASSRGNLRAVSPVMAMLRRAVVAALVLTGWWWLTISAAEAQEVTCERVPYNERIITVCSTVDAGAGGSPSTTPVPTVVPDEDPDDADGDESDADAADEEDDEEDDDESESGDDGEAGDDGDGDDERIDRGSRGDRVGGDLFDFGEADGEGDGDDDADRTDDASSATTGDADDGTDDGRSSDGARADVASGTGSSGADGVFIGTVDPEPSSLPLVIASTAMFGVGAAFLMAARRGTRSLRGP